MASSGICTSAGLSLVACSVRERDVEQPAALLVREALELPKAQSGRAETITALLGALLTKSPHTAAHCVRVGAYAALLARSLDLPETRIHHVERCGLLHDIGKLGIPQEVLEKEGPLTPGEWELVRLHPLIGTAVLQGIPWLAATLPAIAMHHERWDGAGYPHGVSGHAIPLEARIVGLCDAYDTMTSERSYKPRMAVDQAMGRLREDAGTHFDPELVAIFLQEVLPELPEGRI